MKKNNFNIYLLFLILSASFIRCSNELDDNNKSCSAVKEEIPVSVKFNSKPLSSSLNCQLFVFSKNATENEYLFKDSIQINSGGNTFKLMNKEIYEKDFRFLFIASPSQKTEIAMLVDTGSSLSVGDKWEDVKIQASQENLSSENYYAIIDKSGDEIFNERTIEAELTRLVGQFTFDFFRTSPDNKSPIDIVSDAVSSVLDRIYEIEISYKYLTESISFTNSKNINPLTPKTNSSKQVIKVNTNSENDLRVSVSKNEDYLDFLPTGEKGAVRIYGLYSLPTPETSSVNIEMTFRYFDTTPTCDNKDGKNHQKDCFTEKELKLSLPSSSFSSNIWVKSDFYTVNKAAILFDRVIDLGVNSSLLLISTDWE